MRDAGGQLAERGELFGLHQAVLRGPQVLQRFRQFARAGFHAFEQPHVLDRDHRLVGEGGDQLDLLVAKRLHCTTRQQNHADWISFAQEGDAEHGAIVGLFLDFDHRVFRIRKNVRHMNCLAKYNRSPDHAPSPWLVRDALEKLVQFRGKTVGRSVIISRAFLTRNGSHIRLAKPRGRLSQRIEHRL